MWFSLVGNLIPYAIDIIVSYIKSTDSSKDDKVLEVVQLGAEYLANKDNNNVTKQDCEILKTKKVKD